MQKIELKQIPHSFKIGDICGDITPNITEDTLFLENGEVIGFYIKDMIKYSERTVKLAEVANAELLSERVPKQMMDRSSGVTHDPNTKVPQFSTIIGSIPPKFNMRRPYPSRSSVHNVKSAETFVRAMLQLCHEGEELIKQLTPHIFESQVKIINEKVPEKWRFLYSLNPMVGVIDGFRWAILGGNSQLYLPGFILSMALVVLLLVSGIWYFRKMERTFADVI
jgi:hypothetical protein